MNVLFLTLVSFDSLQVKMLYSDLLREFVRHGHDVYVISPCERRENIPTHVIQEDRATILRLRIGNTQKTNLIEKGISTLLIERQFTAGIKQYFRDVKFDLVLYSTPPITLVSAIDFVKKRDQAKTYLLLKDIFPQNAVDLGMLTTTGPKGLIYKHFRRKEKKLYRISDRIGAMSQANVDYVIQHNPEVDPKIVEVCPNSIEVVDKSVDAETRNSIRAKYGIPLDKKVFVYGGNLGKPQGIPFLIECLRKCEDIEEAYFLIVGDGTEYGLLENYVDGEKPRNVRLMQRLPKDEYDVMVGACDVGLLFLDHRFTIPNFPSRLLSYMQAKLPVFAVTDPNTDVGKVITDGGFGWWCESNDSVEFKRIIDMIIASNKCKDNDSILRYLQNHYNSSQSYEIICGRYEE